MGENVCCPYLRTLECGDTREHRHFGCNPKIILSQDENLSQYSLMDNDWVKTFCMSQPPHD
jgi:hypothetical protein